MVLAAATAAAFLAFSPPPLRAAEPSADGDIGDEGCDGNPAATVPATLTCFSGQAIVLRVDNIAVTVPGPMVI